MTSGSARPGLVRNVALNAIGQGSPLLIAVFLIPVLLERLGVERFGLLALTWALVGRAILSWIDPGGRWAITRVLADATEPLIAPIRQIIPPIGMIDISFIVAIVLLQVLQRLLITALG